MSRAVCVATSQLFLVNALFAAEDVRLGCLVCWMTSTAYHGATLGESAFASRLMALDVAVVNSVMLWFLLRLHRCPGQQGRWRQVYTWVTAAALAFAGDRKSVV